MSVMAFPLSAQQRSEFTECVKRGELVVVPTDTVYGIGANPWSSAAVDRLLTAKGRGRDFPSPVLVGDENGAKELVAELSPLACALMRKFWPGALTLVLRARPELPLDLGVTGGTVAVRVPAQAELCALLREVGPLAVTSANLHGEPPALDVKQARAYFGPRVAVYLDGGKAAGGVPSTIVKVEGERFEILREGALSAREIECVAREMQANGQAEPIEEPENSDRKTA